MSKMPGTLGELRRSAWSEKRLTARGVKQEIRENLLARLAAKQQIFPGVHGYEDSVIPQIVNALLSRHNFILLGLRGQAKSRVLRGLVALLDEEIPVVAGSEINDNPYRPISRYARELIGEKGDATPIGWIPRDRRFVEKLATPDVTIADILGDLDPIRAARGGRDLSDELTIHYGLLPRANRGIFAINELPDLAGKIQVGLFNVMQEGDVQIKGYPVRMPLDVLLVFTANPEDYTARGKIITPLKDRIGAEIRTHYPAAVPEAMAITAQEAWTSRDAAPAVHIPHYLAETVEEIAFQARGDKRVDQRSGVSQRLPISLLETITSAAEQRAVRAGDAQPVARVADIYAALPAITGKIELEYEGELRGADTVARDLIRAATGKIFSARFSSPAQHAALQKIVRWFELGGELRVDAWISGGSLLQELRRIEGLELLSHSLLERSEVTDGARAAAAEFVLEGLWAQRRINRSEERGYFAEARREAVAPEPLGKPPRRAFN